MTELSNAADPMGPDQGYRAPRTVRVLRDEGELAEAVARAEESARRLHERLAARAARDEWMAEHSEERSAWRHVDDGDIDRLPPLTALHPESAKPLSKGDGAPSAPDVSPATPATRSSSTSSAA